MSLLRRSYPPARFVPNTPQKQPVLRYSFLYEFIQFLFHHRGFFNLRSIDYITPGNYHGRNPKSPKILQRISGRNQEIGGFSFFNTSCLTSETDKLRVSLCGCVQGESVGNAAELMEVIAKYRRKSREIWEDKFRGDENSKRFINEVLLSL